MPHVCAARARAGWDDDLLQLATFLAGQWDDDDEEDWDDDEDEDFDDDWDDDEEWEDEDWDDDDWDDDES